MRQRSSPVRAETARPAVRGGSSACAVDHCAAGRGASVRLRIERDGAPYIARRAALLIVQFFCID
jgi:hypothetical protein